MAEEVEGQEQQFIGMHIFRDWHLSQKHFDVDSDNTSTIKSSIFMLQPSIGLLLDEFIQPHFCLFVYAE